MSTSPRATRAYREPNRAPCRTTPRGRPRGSAWSPTTQTPKAMPAASAARPGAPSWAESRCVRSPAVLTPSFRLDGRLVAAPLARLEALSAVGGDVVAGLAVHAGRLGVPVDLLGVDDRGVLVGEGPGAERSAGPASRGHGPAARRQVADVERGTGRLQLVEHGDQLGVDGVAAQGEVLAPAGRLVRDVGLTRLGVGGGLVAQLAHAEHVAVHLVLGPALPQAGEGVAVLQGHADVEPFGVVLLVVGLLHEEQGRVGVAGHDDGGGPVGVELDDAPGGFTRELAHVEGVVVAGRDGHAVLLLEV